MTAATISIIDTDVFTALRAFLIAVLPTGTEVIQLQDNGVPMPAGGFVGMNNSSNKRLSTNVVSYEDDVPGGVHNKLIGTPTTYTMALDFYGPSSGPWAATVQALFRDESSSGLFPDGIQPLYADDPIQMPLINGEAQYEDRWRMDAVMEVNAVITIGQEFADALSVGIKSVDAEYPPA